MDFTRIMVACGCSKWSIPQVFQFRVKNKDGTLYLIPRPINETGTYIPPHQEWRHQEKK